MRLSSPLSFRLLPSLLAPVHIFLEPFASLLPPTLLPETI